jgi:hypothetical protein
MSFSHGSGLMFLRDSQLDFLVDSGASLSIIPFSSSQTPLGPKLLGANGASIPTWGFQTKTIKIGTKNFEQDFLLAKVAIPILGLDFFRKFQLSIHPLQCQVMDKAGQPISAIFAAAAAADRPPQQEVRSLPRSAAAADRAPAAPTKEVRHPLSAAADMAAETPLQEVSMNIPEPVRRLLAKYPSIIRSETLTPTPTNGVEHVIDTGGNRPVFSPKRAASHLTSCASPKPSSKNSKQQVSSAGPTPPGRPPSTWWPRRTAPGDPAATKGGSTPSQRQTGTPC